MYCLCVEQQTQCLLEEPFGHFEVFASPRGVASVVFTQVCIGALIFVKIWAKGYRILEWQPEAYPVSTLQQRIDDRS